MIQANIHHAKTQLSKLIERAEAGEEVVIARNGKPAVRLTPLAVHVDATPRKPRNIVGCMKGEIWMVGDEEMRRFDEELAHEMTERPVVRPDR